MFERFNPAILVPGALVAVTAIFFMVRHYFSPEARLRRRRYKNYGHTISKAKGPSVKLAANVEQAKE